MGIDVSVKQDGKLIYFEGIGSATNFYEMLLAIQHSLENGEKGFRFPILQRTPDYEAAFTMEETIALKSEVEMVLRELDEINEEYKGVTYMTYKGPVLKDFNFPRKAIKGRLEVILKGCEIAIIDGGTLEWFY